MTRIHTIKKFLSICLLIFVFGIINSQKVNAAELYYDPPTTQVFTGSDFSTNVLLDTKDESVNAVEITVRYPKELLAIRGWDNGGSIINFLIQEPKIDNGIISFQGIIPGGYKGNSGLLLQLNFVARESGDGVLSFVEPTQALLNDGVGTKATLKINSFEFKILDQEETRDLKFQTPHPRLSIDTSPPEKFKPEISRMENLFGGKYFLVFATQDKGSGIDRYEVCEESKTICGITGSPYLLRNQKLDKKIFVKAIDKAGNERIEIIYPPYWRPWYKNYWILGALGIVIILMCYIMRKVVWQKFTR